MMRSRRIFISSLLFIFILIIGGPQLKAEDLQKLKLDVFQKEAEFKSDTSSEALKYDLLHAYEQLTYRVCMPLFLKTYQYAGKPVEPKCLELLDKIDQIADYSLASTCIKQGTESKKCKLGYQNQYALPKPSTSRQSFSGRTSNEEYIYVDEKIVKAQKSYTKKRNLPDLKMIMSFYKRVIPKACSDVSLNMVPESDIPVSKTSYFEDKKEQEKIKDLLSSLDRDANKEPDNPFGDNAIKKEKLVRVRYFSNNCFELIDTLLETHPLSSFAVCVRDGKYSPQCVDSIEQEKSYIKKLKAGKATKTKKTNSQYKPKTKGNFAEF